MEQAIEAGFGILETQPTKHPVSVNTLWSLSTQS